MGKQAERLAKRENRTMSELMREAFRRYQENSASASPTMADALQLLRADARRRGLDKLTKREIDNVIAQARREMAARILTGRSKQ